MQVIRYWRPLTLALAALLGVATAVSGIGHPVESGFQALRHGLQPRKASRQIHVIEMDAASIAAIDRWPWPRRNYASVVDQLNRAGVASIAFDVDFSSPSNPSDDSLFAQSLKRSRIPVILPTFSQSAQSSDRRSIDALPIAALRSHAALAAVSVEPDADGLVRNMLMGTITAHTPRPSLSAFLSKRSGAADEQFPIDYAIDPATIPRHSFVDIRDGRFDPAAIAGKDILIGATAVEMGDRYAVPQYGVVPGVIIQALAAETLLRGRPHAAGWLWPLIAMLAWSVVLISCRSGRSIAASAVGGIAVLFGTAVVAEAALYEIFAIVPAMVVIATGTAATAVRRVWDVLQHRRTHDTGTGLPNRAAMVALPAGCEVAIAVAVVQGFDRLAAVVSAEGANVLIARVAERLRFASDSAIVYRIEDRALAWLIDGAEAKQRLDAITALMLNPIEVDGRRVDVSLACGVAVGKQVESALTDAALAASEAARAGVPWQLAAVDQEELAQQISLMGELSDALLQGQLEVAYQPKLDIASEQITSVEALVRWRHPVRGYLRPDLFVPLAEQSDRILGLTLFVLERTMTDLAWWATHDRRLRGAVNISATLVTSDAFAEGVRELLERDIIPNCQLIFEITESATLTRAEDATSALERFRDMGISISMDDYGTGQSTLSYIKNLPLSELKIDRSFVQFAHINKSDAVLVCSTIDLAHQLDLKVVAEGVEDEECLEFLRDVGCDMAQGYLIGKPMPREAMLDSLDMTRRAAA